MCAVVPEEQQKCCCLLVSGANILNEGVQSRLGYLESSSPKPFMLNVLHSLSKSVYASDLEYKPSGETLLPLDSAVCLVSASGCSRLAILEGKQGVLRLSFKGTTASQPFLETNISGS